MWILIIPVVAIGAAWIYGATKVAQKAPPIAHDPAPTPQIDLFAQLALIRPGDILTVDIAKFNVFHGAIPSPPLPVVGPVFFKATGTLDVSTGIVMAISADPRLPNNPLGIGDRPVPVPATAITAVNAPKA